MYCGSKTMTEINDLWLHSLIGRETIHREVPCSEIDVVMGDSHKVWGLRSTSQGKCCLG